MDKGDQGVGHQALAPLSAASDVDKANAFYKEILGLEVLTGLGWIRAYGSSSKMTIQVSVMSEGGV